MADPTTNDNLVAPRDQHTSAAADTTEPVARQEKPFKLSKTVIVVKNFPAGATEEEAKPLVEEFGSVESIRFRSIRQQTQTRMIGIKYTTEDEAKAAVNGLNGLSFQEQTLVSEPKRMYRRNRRKGKGKVGAGGKRTRYKRVVEMDPLQIVVNVRDENQTEETVTEFFAQFGEIDTSRELPSGITYFITYKNEDSVKAALEKNGEPLGDCEMRVRQFSNIKRVPVEVEEAPQQVEPKQETGAKKKRNTRRKKANNGNDETKSQEGASTPGEGDAKPQKKRKPRRTKYVFVAGFPEETEPEMLLDLFEGSERASVRNQTAYVDFDSPALAAACVEKFHGKQALGSSQPLRVEPRIFRRRPNNRRKGQLNQPQQRQ